MIAESIAVISMYWPQSISIGDPIHEEGRTTWVVTSNNAVNINFSDEVEGLKLSDYQSIHKDSIMPGDNGRFKVSIYENDKVTLTVNADEKGVQ